MTSPSKQAEYLKELEQVETQLRELDELGFQTTLGSIPVGFHLPIDETKLRERRDWLFGMLQDE